MDYILGIDHGNGNMKTEHVVFPCGFHMQETKPDKIFAKDIIEYDNKYYTLTPSRIQYETDKTKNDNAFVLTLFAIAKEIIARRAEEKPDFNVERDFAGFIGKDVILAVGLPPAHIEKQRDAFKKYFLDRAVHGINFKYNDKPFSFYLKKVLIFPQDYAGVSVFKSDMLTDYTTCHCIDIGDGTVDLVVITDHAPDKDKILSREYGMSILYDKIIDDVITDYGITMTRRNVEDFLSGKKTGLAPDMVEKITPRIKASVADFTRELVNMLHKKVPDFQVSPTIFCGGGAMALKPYLEETGAFGITEFIPDIKANAIAYQKLAEMVQQAANMN